MERRQTIASATRGSATPESRLCAIDQRPATAHHLHSRARPHWPPDDARDRRPVSSISGYGVHASTAFHTPRNRGRLKPKSGRGRCAIQSQPRRYLAATSGNVSSGMIVPYRGSWLRRSDALFPAEDHITHPPTSATNSIAVASAIPPSTAIAVATSARPAHPIRSTSLAMR